MAESTPETPIPAPTPPPAQSPPPAPEVMPGPDPGTFIIERFVGLALDKARGILTTSGYETASVIITRSGHWAMLGSIAVVLVVSLIHAGKNNSLDTLLLGLAAAPLLLVIQYTACKFIRATQALVASTPTFVSTPAFTDCLGLVALCASVAILVDGIKTSISFKDIDFMWLPLLQAAGAVFVAWISLTPSLANVSTKQTASSAEEAIAILGYSAKVMLKMAPIFFGVGVIVGAIEILFAFRLMFQNDGSWSATYYSVKSTVPMISVAGLAPLALYVGFLVVYLLLDLANALLRAANKYNAS